MKRISAAFALTIVFVLALAGNALAATDTNLTGATDQVKTYFGDNIAVVIGLFIGIAVLLWLLRMALRSVGVGKPKSVS